MVTTIIHKHRSFCLHLLYIFFFLSIFHFVRCASHARLHSIALLHFSYSVELHTFIRWCISVCFFFCFVLHNCDVCYLRTKHCVKETLLELQSLSRFIVCFLHSLPVLLWHVIFKPASTHTNTTKKKRTTEEKERKKSD